MARGPIGREGALRFVCGSAGKYYEENMNMFGELRQVKALSDEQQAGQTTADRSMIGVDGHMTRQHMTDGERRPRTKNWGAFSVAGQGGGAPSGGGTGSEAAKCHEVAGRCPLCPHGVLGRVRVGVTQRHPANHDLFLGQAEHRTHRPMVV